jgi:hypothetical protein
MPGRVRLDQIYQRAPTGQPSADLGGELFDHVAQRRGHLGVLPRVLAVERRARYRQLDRLDDPGAGASAVSMSSL